MKRKKMERLLLEWLSLVPLVVFQLLLSGYVYVSVLLYWYDRSMPLLIINILIYLWVMAIMRRVMLSNYRDYLITYDKEFKEEGK